jgi:cell division transport system ATP-binding protein
VVLFDGVSMGGPGQAPWLRRLSFALPPGSFHVLTGEAGCGKTSVLGLIGLAQRPAAGRVEMFGRDTATLGRGELARFRRRVGRVFADDRLIDHLSVFDNAALIPRLAGRPRRDHAPEVAQILAWVGLGRRMDALPASLSAGERRRLAIARAMANRAEIVLADEPTGGLDEDGARRVLRLLAELNTAGTTVVMATRDEDLAAASGAPVLRLHQGHLARVEGIDGAAGP